MENFISENITYLLRSSNLSQDDYGLQFDLKKGVINQYIQKKSLPKIETIQKICKHHRINIDDFINLDLSSAGTMKTGPVKTTSEQPPKYQGKDEIIESLKETVATQKETIEAQRELLSNYKERLGNAS